MIGKADAGRVSAFRAPAASERGAHAGAHSVPFYADDQFLLDRLEGMVGAALDAGNAAIVNATRASASWSSTP